MDELELELELEDNTTNGRLIDNKRTLFQIFQDYLKYRYWILLSLLCFSIFGFLYSKTQVPEFNLSIKLLIKDDGKSGDKNVLQQLDLYSTDKIIDNEIQILKSDMLMEKVVKNLQLQTSYFADEKFKKTELYKRLPFKIELIKPSGKAYEQNWGVNKWDNNTITFDGKEIQFNHPVSTAAGIILVTHQPYSSEYYTSVSVSFNTYENLARIFNSSLSIAPSSKQSTVLFITIEDSSSDRGKDILNELANVYSQFSIENKNKTISNTLSFIESRLSSVASDLSNVEQNVQRYKSSNNITDISSQASAFLNNIQTNDSQIAQIDLGFSILKNLEDYLKGGTLDQMKVPALQGITDPTLTALVNELSAAQLKKESLLRTVPQTNPVVNSLNDQIKALKVTILQTVDNVRSGMKLNRQFLSQSNAKFGSLVKSVPTKERQLVDVMRDRDIKNNLFIFLLQKREEAAMSLAATVSDSQTIDAAKSTGMFFKPAKNVIYIAFLSLGLLIPVGIIYLISALDSTVRNKFDIVEITNTPILGQISRSDDSNPLVTIEKPRSMVSEEIRALRTNLAFVLPDPEQKVILFTSNVSGEGKSYVSLNLAASLASTGKKVVVLELDLRKPKFNSMLGFEGGLGLSNYLIGQVPLSEIKKTLPGLPNYTILTSGVVPPNPAELLLSHRVEELLLELRKDYDYILLDAPPIGLLADAQILSKHANCTMFLVRYGYTRKVNIADIENFRRRKIFKRLSIVFNSVENKGLGYGYGYGYYENESDKRNKLFGSFRRK